MDEGKFKQSASCNQAPLARANNKRNVCQLLKIRLIDYCERNVTPKTSNHIFFSKFFAKRKKLINKLKRLNVSNRVAKRERAKRKAKRRTTSCHFKFVSHKSKVSANFFSKFDLTKNTNKNCYDRSIYQDCLSVSLSTCRQTNFIFSNKINHNLSTNVAEFSSHIDRYVKFVIQTIFYY